MGSKDLSSASAFSFGARRTEVVRETGGARLVRLRPLEGAGRARLAGPRVVLHRLRRVQVREVRSVMRAQRLWTCFEMLQAVGPAGRTASVTPFEVLCATF